MVEKLNAMHTAALKQIRSGDSNDFLVGYLTTATMLELSNLLIADLEPGAYAQAVADVLTQYTPIDQCRVQFNLPGFPTVVAASGELNLHGTTTVNTAPSFVGTITLDSETCGSVIGEDVPDPLVQANFIQAVADHVAAGLGKILYSQTERRATVVQRVVSVIERLDQNWGAEHLTEICAAISGLADVSAVALDVTASRLGGKVLAHKGTEGPHTSEREFRIDNCVECELRICYTFEPGSTQHGELDTIVGALNAAMAQAEQQTRLAHEAETDALTGLWNRRRVSKALTAVRNNVAEHGGSFAVALFDLDHFKQVNDTHGHLVGDNILIEFAKLLRATARLEDTAARWGGEEFLLLMPGYNEQQAAQQVANIIETCPGVCAHILPGGTAQTVSAGVVSSADYPQASNEGLIKEADAALYRAKRAGRDRYHTGSS